jgi:putative effector of murein hydrolase LrgA (UPF0299 family)
MYNNVLLLYYNISTVIFILLPIFISVYVYFFYVESNYGKVLFIFTISSLLFLYYGLVYAPLIQYINPDIFLGCLTCG